MIKPAQAMHFMDGALDSDDADSGMVNHGQGDLVGRYKLIERIGEGGFGVVWRASQVEPITRDVAIKIVRAEMDSGAVVARFHAEQQALARMAHPGIAAVLDAGSTDLGEPFFAMELVNGSPITGYCRAHHSSMRDRVALVIQVCRAIQHAHQKAVLHRDLKPGNILVAMVDGKPVAKVIDFGIAKALGEDNASGQTMAMTQAGLILGTPEYMAPEQAAPGADAEDSRVDVYAIGVILYELITGITPLAARAAGIGGVRSQPIHVLLRWVCEDEAARPSQMLKKRAMAGDYVPEGVPLKAVHELDWVILKALEIKPDKRYATAGALGDDLQRYLDNEPLSVAPPDLFYRLSKLARRHPKASAAVLSAMFCVLVLVGTISYDLVRESRAHALADVLRAQAEKSESIARGEVDKSTKVIEFLSSILDEAGEQIAKGKNAEAVMSALRKGEKQVTKLQGNNSLRAQLQGKLASAYDAMGDSARSLPFRVAQMEDFAKFYGADDDRTLDAARELADVYMNTSNHNLAVQLYADVAERFEKKGKSDTAPWYDARRRQAQALTALNRHQEALAILHSLEPRSNGRTFGSEDDLLQGLIAQLEAMLGNPQKSRQTLEALLQKLEGGKLENRRAQSRILELLARVDAKESKHLDAAHHLERSVENIEKMSGPMFPSISDTAIGVARAYQKAGKSEDALRWLDRADKVAKNAGGEAKITHCIRARAEVLADIGRSAESLAVYEVLYPRLASANDARPALLFETKGVMCGLRSKIGKHQEAMRSTLEVMRELEAAPSVANDTDLWQSMLLHSIEVFEAAAKAGETAPVNVPLDGWKKKYAVLQQSSPQPTSALYTR